VLGEPAGDGALGVRPAPLQADDADLRRDLRLRRGERPEELGDVEEVVLDDDDRPLGDGARGGGETAPERGHDAILRRAGRRLPGGAGLEPPAWR
jgi:hypothetical protein